MPVLGHIMLCRTSDHFTYLLGKWEFQNKGTFPNGFYIEKTSAIFFVQGYLFLFIYYFEYSWYTVLQ